MTKKEYLIKMVEECLDVQVDEYDASENPAHLSDYRDGSLLDYLKILTQHPDRITLTLRSVRGGFDSDDAQKLKDWMTKHGAKVQNTVNTAARIVFQCEEYPWQCYTEPKPEMFEPGTKVRFTQEAKDRFDDRWYWHYANSCRVQERLDETFTVASADPENDWPFYKLEEMNMFSFADYLLEEVPEEKEQPKSKPEVAEIIRLREENKELKAKIQELEAKLKDQEEETEQGNVHFFKLPGGFGFGFGFGW